jgi:hypothetical protein
VAASPDVLPCLVKQDALGLARHQRLGRGPDQLQNAALVLLLRQPEREGEQPSECCVLVAVDVTAVGHGYHPQSAAMPGSRGFGAGGVQPAW